MKKSPLRLIRAMVTALFIAFLAIIGLRWGFMWKQEYHYERKGAVLIAQIENFQSKQARLPDTVLELGLEEPEDEGPYYEKKDSITYRVFYPIGFDWAYTYWSSTKQWKEVPM